VSLELSADITVSPGEFPKRSSIDYGIVMLLVILINWPQAWKKRRNRNGTTLAATR